MHLTPLPHRQLSRGCDSNLQRTQTLTSGITEACANDWSATYYHFFLTALRVDVCCSVNTAGLLFKLKASIEMEYASLLFQLIIS